MNGELESHEEDNICLFYNRDERLSWSKERMRNIVRSIAEGENRPIKKISVIIGDDELLHLLNREWLEVDTPTDVLAFNLGDVDGEELEGDIYISLDRAMEQAGEYGVTPETELLRLAAHGMLHLCGMDHNDDVSLRDVIDRGENYVRMV